MITIPMRSQSSDLVPERRVKVQRAKDKITNLAKEQQAVRQSFKPPLDANQRKQLARKQSVGQKRMTRLKSALQVEQKKLQIAQRIDQLTNKRNNTQDAAQRKSINVAIRKLKDQMGVPQPVRRKGAKKMAKRKVFAHAER